MGVRREAGRSGAAGADGFAPRRAGASGAGAANGGAPTLALASLGALVALQGLPDALERRRRAVRHGASLLERLEEVRLVLLDGEMPADALVRLQSELASVREAADDPSLEDVVREIEVRAAVELAKLDPNRAAA